MHIQIGHSKAHLAWIMIFILKNKKNYGAGLIFDKDLASNLVDGNKNLFKE